MIVAFKASKRNQCPWNWFNTQALTIEDKTSTIIWHMCQVKGGRAWLVILIADYNKEQLPLWIIMPLEKDDFTYKLAKADQGSTKQLKF
jgi:hypothetical protein